MFKSSRHFISELEKAGELLRIKEFVNPELEIAEVVDRISKSHHNKGLLFENTKAPPNPATPFPLVRDSRRSPEADSFGGRVGDGLHSFPLLINAYGSEKRMCMVLGVEKLDDVAKRIEALFHTLSSPKDSLVDKLKLLPQLNQVASWMPKKIKGRGGCQEVIMSPSQMGRAGVGLFPVMKCWPFDGGKFLTLPIIHTTSPNSGIRNVGLYRMQVFGPQLTALHWHKHKVSAGHFNEYKKSGKKMPVAVALGGDPIYAFCAACPLPPNMDEYMFAGFLRKKKVELVKCLSQEIYVPADADIIIEGYVDPNEEFILEGPFGDHTGYYSLADYYPKFHITCITHRKNAVYPSTIVGIPPQEDAWIGKAIERIFLAPLKMTIAPEIIDMNMPAEGVFHNLNIVKIKNEYQGQAQKVMNALWGAGQMMFNKIMVIVDEDVNIHNYEEVARCVSENVNPHSDIYFSQGPMDVLDHACSQFAFGGKMCIDATLKSKVKSQKSKESSQKQTLNTQLSILNTHFPEIVAINDSLLQKGISVLFISVKKNRKNHIKELNEKIFSLINQVPPLTGEVRRGLFVIYIEHTIDVNDIRDCIWRFTNNFDPKRDSYLFPLNEGGASAFGGAGDVIGGIGLDGTRKTKTFDDFHRPWPNIICSDEATIKSVDEKWSTLFPSREGQGVGFIPSPSLKYRKQLYKGGAVAEE